MKFLVMLYRRLKCHCKYCGTDTFVVYKGTDNTEKRSCVYKCSTIYLSPKEVKIQKSLGTLQKVEYPIVFGRLIREWNS